MTPLYFFKNTNRFVVTLFLLAVTILSGCNDMERLEDAAGSYYGLVTEGANNATEQHFTSGNLVRRSKRVYDLQLETANQERSWWIQVRVSGSKELTLTTKHRQTDRPFFVTLIKASDFCFVDDRTQARLCIYGSELYIEMPEGLAGITTTIVVDRADSSRRPPQFEPPQSFTVTEILDRAMNMSFDSRIDFERVVQSRLNAQHAALSLLPRISASTVLSFLVFGPLGPLAVIGDLAPFLFPSRWTQARQAEITSEADYMGYLLAKADAANMAEGMALMVERDGRTLTLLNEAHTRAESLRADFTFRHDAGIISTRELDEVTGAIGAIARTATMVQYGRNQQLRALAMAMGFYNPNTISAIIDNASRAIGPTAPSSSSNRQRLVELALSRSYELRQMDLLIEASRLSSAERHMAWLDPTGNPSGALGFSLPSYIQIGYSQIRELEHRRERTRAQIIQSVYDTLDLIERSQTMYGMAIEGVGIQERRLATLVENYAFGTPITGTELILALQELSRVKSEVLDAEYGYHIAQSRLNRLLYVGPYSLLNPERGRAAIERSVPIVGNAEIAP